MTVLTRRSFLRGLVAAPAIVAASNIMPIRGLLWSAPKDDIFVFNEGYVDIVSTQILTLDDIKRGIEMLKRQHIDAFGGRHFCYVSPTIAKVSQ